MIINKENFKIIKAKEYDHKRLGIYVLILSSNPDRILAHFPKYLDEKELKNIEDKLNGIKQKVLWE